MARIFTDGAEDPIGTNPWVVSGATRSTTLPRSGSYSWKMTNASIYRTISAVDELYFRVAWYTEENTDAVKSVRFRNGTTELVTLGLSTVNSNFRVRVFGSVVATGTFVYGINTWYVLKFRVKIADSGGIIQLKVDGILDIDYSGDTKPGTATTVDNILLASVMGYGSGTYHYFDDIALNDTTGAADNSWCDDGRVKYLPSNGSGDATQLTPNTGANYAAVDETEQDGDTTYVEGDTVGEYDLYNLAASGLPTGSTINRVIPVASAKDTVANGGKIALGLKTNSTEYFGSDLPLTTGYTSVQGTEYLVNPQTGVAWTIAELDALQVGVKARGT